MAMSEASLIKQGKTLEINTELLSLFPNRTRDAIKGQRRQPKYKDLVAEYVQAGSSVATLGPVPLTSDIITHSLASTSSVVTSSNSEAVPATRPVTRRQKRIANAAAQKSLPPEPPDPPDSPIALSPSSSDSSSVIAMDDPELALSFNEDLEIDSESIAVPSETIIDSSLDALQAVREVRTDMEAANISLMELSVNDSIRQDIASIPESAFSFDDTDFKIIDYLDLLFRSDRISMLSNELKEAWTDFRIRPCKETLFIRTRLIFEVLLPDKTPSNVRPRVVRSASPREALSRRVRRRIEYARAQRLFFKNPSRYSDSLLSPTNTLNEFDPFDDDFRMFWENVMSLPRDSCREPKFTDCHVDVGTTSSLMCPITTDEISKCFPKIGSAPGPDLSTVGELRQISKFELAKIFNIFLLCRRVPDRFCRAKTIFLLKRKDTSNPSDFRPISLTPIPARLLSKILARRLAPTVSLDPEQRGFIESDGISQNTFMLDFVLRHSRERVKRTFIASLDLKKAFDSVSHEAVFAALKAQAVDPEFVELLKSIYKNSTTSFAPYPNHRFSPTCGVKQGDPLSSILFNMVIDQLIKKLKEPIGLEIDGSIMSISAYADDILLFASSSAGLQHLINETSAFLETCNLHINCAKSFTISILADAKNKKTRVDSASPFYVNNAPLNILKANDSFKYLGLNFSAKGLVVGNCNPTLNNYLAKLKSAPLKPQQRIWILKNTLLPKLFHLLVLSFVPAGKLAKLDSITRAFVRGGGALFLPGDRLPQLIHSCLCC
ncbi:Retrovirus-related Pol polyprotein from type-2 retrotransposable element R2DM [Araneus ventricosus]|uniref:Retrovirus-related Pol polyprotein from type-2 retrotransposable element R2DM n=1 Tax=Araneus ventricosus TaxID=182803 RepID=A0A4Y2FAA1_ARAVE|nr:Retrovirus-related Pol polyprotein from type-2 retrotransposable element R2DM [Araneus ventricosus]